ncbi:hypothetical protein MTO96_037130 [Rhipicephalus appendiculatus]
MAPVPFVAPTNAVSRGSSKPRREGTSIVCFRCGGEHLATHCRHLNSVCHNCKLKGHLSRVCKGKKGVANSEGQAPPAGKKKSVHAVDDVDDTGSDGTEKRLDAPQVYDMWKLQGAEDTQPFRVEVSVNGILLQMELDTGASVSVVSEDTFRRKFQSARLEPSTVLLKSYSGKLTPVKGALAVSVRFGSHQCDDLLYVVSGRCPSLMGRGWMKGLGIQLRSTTDVNAVSSIQDVIAEYRCIFDDDQGTFKGVAAKITLQENAKPKFFKPRPVPFAMLDRLDAVCCG